MVDWRVFLRSTLTSLGHIYIHTCPLFFVFIVLFFITGSWGVFIPITLRRVTFAFVVFISQPCFFFSLVVHHSPWLEEPFSLSFILCLLCLFLSVWRGGKDGNLSPCCSRRTRVVRVVHVRRDQGGTYFRSLSMFLSFLFPILLWDCII